MSQVYNEDQQIEQIKEWWSAYGNAIIAVVLAAVVFVAAWQGWHRFEARREAGASILYESLIVALDSEDFDTARNQAELLSKNFRRTVYASYGNLLMAKVAIEKKDYDEAERYFEFVRSKSPSLVMRELASVRSLRLMVNRERYQDALDLIDRTRFKVFSPLVEELKGDAELALGHRDNAKKAYQKALDASTIQRPILKMKLARIVNLDAVHLARMQQT